ncbi:MAG: glycosyltransferase family 2 protein, partial [Opitutales bacterium]
GAILSHDFVEAALMRRAGFEVWLAPGLEGSYEEGPPQLEESLQRDRRWCQGNLQHSWLLFSRDFTFPNRLHFLNGIMAYVGSLTWFVFLVLSTLVVVSFARTNLSLFATTGFTRWLELSLLEHGLVLLGVTAVILYGPKLLSIIDLALTPGRRRDFGGWWRASGSAVLETLSSALLAPLLMIWHTIHIVSIFFGARVSWGGADRAGGGVQWGALLLRHGPLALLGAAWLVVAWSFEPTFAAWLAPVAGPLALAPLLVGIFSSRRLGRWLRRRGWLLTPEEVVPPSAVGELVTDRAAVAKRLPAGPPWVARAVADPFLNALHVALEQRQAETFELEMTDEEKTLLEKVLRDGLEGLGAEERRRFLHAPRAVDAAYQGIWTRAPAQLAAEWAAVMSAFRP